MKVDGQELRLQIWDTAGQGATLCALVVVDLNPVLMSTFSFSLACRAIPHNHIWYTYLCMASVA